MNFRSERGSVSLLAAGVMLMVAVMVLGTAAAQETVEPSGQDPAAAADRFAEANGAELVECDCPSNGSDAVVTVHVEITDLLLLRSGREATASARAVVDLSGSGASMPP